MRMRDWSSDVCSSDLIFVGNLLDQRHGGPVTIGFGRYGPNQTLTETMAVHDTMVILEGTLTVSDDHASVTAGPGEIVAMQKGDKVTIRSHADGAVTAYVTRSEEHTSELQSLMRTSYAVFCLK